MPLTIITLKSAAIAKLNDVFRTTLVGGKVVLTAAMADLPPEKKANIFTAVRHFAHFTEENDPHGERDCALFEVDGERYMFKIDYYDKSLERASQDPGDPNVTTRVLSIMLASEI